MISIADMVAIRRAAALGNFVPGFGFRIRRSGEVLIEVGRDLLPAVHPVYGPCEFRWSVAMAISAETNGPTLILDQLYSQTDPETYQPLKIDGTMSPGGHLGQSGLVEAGLANGQSRWVFATLTKLSIVSAIVDSFADEPDVSGNVDGFYDDRLDITIVVVDQIDGLSREDCHRSATLILAETMAHELLHEDPPDAGWGQE